ncbi:MAG: 3-hydroxyacyl-ACP dehydratase FabZ family protein [Phycisphaerae bacterium]
MKFVLIDRIVELQRDRRIVSEKALTLAEEYLADHFPTFPVMPGVLMLEAMVQSAAWLARVSTDFSASLVTLAEARNVTYKSFVAPGRVLELRVDAVRIEPGGSEFRGVGVCGDREMVKAQLRLRHGNLAEKDKALAELDATLIDQARRQFELLRGPAALAGTAAGPAPR